MSRRACCCLILLTGQQADADTPTISATSEQPAANTDPPPLIRFDQSVRTAIETLDEHTTRVRLSKRAELRITGQWLTIDPEVRLHEQDVVVGKWRAHIGGSYDFGWARIDAHAGIEQVDSEINRYKAGPRAIALSRGRTVDVGVALTRTFSISKTTTGFVSLSLDHRQWIGQPPPGEVNATTLMLLFGLRW